MLGQNPYHHHLLLLNPSLWNPGIPKFYWWGSAKWCFTLWPCHLHY
jgi:hypothetical protein